MADAPRVLVVAGHDPSFAPGRGGAGLDADREALAAFGVEARCVVTAWTKQRGGRVEQVGARDPGAWLIEARAELADAARAPFAAVKVGLLPGAEHVRALARLRDELPPRLPFVLDPVIAASGGEVFLDDEGVAALLAELVPRGVVLTPNLAEAARLAPGAASAERLAADPEARVAVARALVAAGADGVVVKGGHGREAPAVDVVLAAGGEPVLLAHARHAGAGLHGSGCRFASAVAAGLARGRRLSEAAADAGEWVAARIASTTGAP